MPMKFNIEIDFKWGLGWDFVEKKLNEIFINLQRLDLVGNDDFKDLKEKLISWKIDKITPIKEKELIR